MKRLLVLLLLWPAVSSAQDMPLFTWAKNGEGWAKSSVKAEATPRVNFDDRHAMLTDPLTQKTYRWTAKQSDPHDGKPTCVVASKDGGTVFVGFADRGAVWVYQVNQDGQLVNGDAYAPLRIRQGYDNSKEALAKLKNSPPTVPVVALTRDSNGRIYAATKLGVQVFDPTGRPSGNLPLPDTSDPTAMSWATTPKNILIVETKSGSWQRELLASRD